MAKLESFTRYNSFFYLMKSTKKYKELIKECSARFAFLFTAVLSVLFVYIFNENTGEFINVAMNLIEILLPALIGLLGFYIAGLAIMASLIGKKTIELLDERSQIENLAGVLFCYYFAAAAVLITVIIFLFCYLFMVIDYQSPVWITYLCIFLSSYSFLFSICYTVSLLGSCINFLFLIFKMESL